MVWWTVDLVVVSEVVSEIDLLVVLVAFLLVVSVAVLAVDTQLQRWFCFLVFQSVCGGELLSHIG